MKNFEDYSISYRMKNENLDKIGMITRKVMEIHYGNRLGDILIFMTGEEDIQKLCVNLVTELGNQLRRLVDSGYNKH